MKYRDLTFACLGSFLLAGAVSYLSYRITRAETEVYFYKNGLVRCVLVEKGAKAEEKLPEQKGKK